MVSPSDTPTTRPMKFGGEGLAGKQGEADEQRQGSNRLGTAHGISGTARTDPILLRSGRKGDSADRKFP